MCRFACTHFNIIKYIHSFRYSRLNANIDHSENIPSISELLNLEPNVAHNNRKKAIDIICTYLKQLYRSQL